MYQQASPCELDTVIDELHKHKLQLMESCCDIIYQLPTDVYHQVFGDKVKAFLQLKTLTSKVNAKIVQFGKLQSKQVRVTAKVPEALPPPTTSAPAPEWEDFGESDLDLFLKMNEEERDKWGVSDDTVNKDCNGK